ncbi:MAG: hypothetical protein A3H93_19315 [Rhodocyclales bacterium RIFCSPLOWO2_02_FULL_63_24]|nr:MAG: hypothetical protein A3H93_19315 [Rhodocyclales bacterium RIFCSPLOWO2_02_FULL_63_24]
MRNGAGGLDLTDELAEYVRMDADDEISRSENQPPVVPGRSRRVLWTIGLLALAIVTIAAFGAYRQPELLLNLMGLRYCG